VVSSFLFLKEFISSFKSNNDNYMSKRGHADLANLTI
jgi:hypothetical protein